MRPDPIATGSKGTAGGGQRQSRSAYEERCRRDGPPAGLKRGMRKMLKIAVLLWPMIVAFLFSAGLATLGTAIVTILIWQAIIVAQTMD